MTPLRIAMVTTFYPPYHFGGDAMYVYRLTEALAERGHRIDVVHSVDAFRLQHPADPEVAFSHHPHVTLHRLESHRPAVAALASHQLGRPALYRRRLRDVLESRTWDVIHYHNVSLMGAPGLLEMGRAPVKLYTANEYWLICPTHVLFAFDREACTERRCLACTLAYKRPPQAWRYTGALRRGLRHVDRILVPSRFAVEQHRAQGVDRPLVHLPYFIPPPPAIDAPVRPDVPVPDRPFFLYVGRLEKLKGVQDVLRLFADYREADLVIVGAGSYEPVLRAQARGLTHVRFLAKVHPAALAAIYRRAVAVLVPSLCYETFGLTAAEAQAHGTPAIVRRIGALAENIEQSGGGLSFATLEECRAAMERLRTQPDLRDEMGRRGAETVRARWSVEAHLAQYLEIVARVREEKDATSGAREASRDGEGAGAGGR
jgi:glycosyltransferase involved in cell wall biosynthesis